MLLSSGLWIFVLLLPHQYNVGMLPNHPNACCRQRQTAVTWPVFEAVVILFTRLIADSSIISKVARYFCYSVASSSSSAWLATWYFKELGFIPITNSHAVSRSNSHSYLMKYDVSFQSQWSEACFDAIHIFLTAVTTVFHTLHPDLWVVLNWNCNFALPPQDSPSLMSCGLKADLLEWKTWCVFLIMEQENYQCCNFVQMPITTN